MASQPSGPAWAKQFPGSNKISDLSSTFGSNVQKFYNAMIKAGAKIRISATYRPPERAYLMHYAWDIAKNKADPAKIPKMSGVDIDWTQGGDRKAAQSAAQQMLNAFAVTSKKMPSLTTRHTEGLAIDMTISWSGTLTITGADGKQVEISSSPKTGMNKDLWTLGAGYGVVKLRQGDDPHWSSDGR